MMFLNESGCFHHFHVSFHRINHCKLKNQTYAYFICYIREKWEGASGNGVSFDFASYTRRIFEKLSYFKYDQETKETNEKSLRLQVQLRHALQDE